MRPACADLLWAVRATVLCHHWVFSGALFCRSIPDLSGCAGWHSPLPVCAQGCVHGLLQASGREISLHSVRVCTLARREFHMHMPRGRAVACMAQPPLQGARRLRGPAPGKPRTALLFPCTGPAACTHVQTFICGIVLSARAASAAVAVLLPSCVVPLVLHPRHMQLWPACGQGCLHIMPRAYCCGKVFLARVLSTQNNRKHAVCCPPQPRRRFLGSVMGQTSARCA